MEGPPSDIIICTSDSLFFYAHREVLLGRSTNNFAGLIIPQDYDEGPVPDYTSSRHASSGLHPSSPQEFATAPLQNIHVSEPSVVFNVILHFIYNMSCERYAPNLDTLTAVFASLPKYGLPRVNTYDRSDIPTALMRYVTASPIRVYALAAENALDSVCILASQYTLDATLDQVSEADALTMGPVYLLRLCFLHMDRLDTLRRLVDTPPATHPLTPSCSMEFQRSVKEAWMTGVGQILMRATAHNTAATALEAAFEPCRVVSPCWECRQLVGARIADVVDQWGPVRRTI
ncbi:hypothetical protein FRB94_000691 [Tulasnella sp. JGI-2019a]|nr:hypothetical protein FRB93_011897 [Tulasnella sp. JGI-2019a]KAG9006453.1 hypothetical protein FRB94_000691 [Tulasnella sp. JGI-2019a]KAG9036937.1 hypothetical protein FRB95_007500 [Tulasnella sp. JGI-2019a]